MKKDSRISDIIGILIFAGGIILGIVAICGHKPAYSIAAYCFLAANAVMTAIKINKDKK